MLVTLLGLQAKTGPPPKPSEGLVQACDASAEGPKLEYGLGFFDVAV